MERVLCMAILRRMLVPDARARAAVSVRNHRGLRRSCAGIAACLLLLSCEATTFDWQGRSPSALSDYHVAYERDAGTRIDGSASWDDFLALAASRRALYLGDHHRDERLHALHRDLLQRLAKHGVRMRLMLEAIGIEDQPHIDAYLAGRIGMEQLVAACRTRWQGSWIAGGDVDAAHYRELLRIAKSLGIRASGIEPTPRLPLSQRDPRIAAQVRAEALADEGALLVVVVGQSHVLGTGRLADRIGLPCTILGARPTSSMRIDATRLRQDFVRTERFVWLFSELLR